MKIGVAIPCYQGHMEMLLDLLESIEKQTRVPDKVVVSCSSTDDFIYCKDYSFPLQIVITPHKKNAAQNRNMAISKLMDMDYITLIDADDIMHPQRIEILLHVFEQEDIDIILHNFLLEKKEFEKIEEIMVRPHSLTQGWTGCIVHKDGYNDTIDRIHHSQVSLRKHIVEKVLFPEEPEFHRREDSVFCHRVFGLENIRDAYIVNELSYYRPSNTDF
jgi:glycosyltransferase involved in cell wall biosynthesis